MTSSHSFHSLEDEKETISFTFGHTYASMIETKSDTDVSAIGCYHVSGGESGWVKGPYRMYRPTCMHGKVMTRAFGCNCSFFSCATCTEMTFSTAAMHLQSKIPKPI